jgi:hypothetical protein
VTSVSNNVVALSNSRKYFMQRKPFALLSYNAWGAKQHRLHLVGYVTEAATWLRVSGCWYLHSYSYQILFKTSSALLAPLISLQKSQTFILSFTKILTYVIKSGSPVTSVALSVSMTNGFSFLQLVSLLGPLVYVSVITKSDTWKLFDIRNPRHCCILKNISWKT